MMRKIHFRSIAFIMALAAVSILVGCKTPAYSIKNNNHIDHSKILRPIGTAQLNEQEVQDTVAKIEERNKTVEDDPEWIKRSYDGLLVRKLNNISEREYESYKKYLDNGKVYIIVHPSFFPFFHYPGDIPDIEEDRGLIRKHNITERFLDMQPKDERFALLQAQERRMRDFIEFMSTNEKLLIVVVPRNYQRFGGYRFKRGPDEYTRYLNEVTNFSKSVLFAESRSPNRGYLMDDDAIRLMEFLNTIDAESIYVGGGYVGRCLEDFYVMLIREYGTDGIFVVPELSDVSPRELNNKAARTLLKPDGNIDYDTATRYMLNDSYRIQEVIPRLKSLR